MTIIDYIPNFISKPYWESKRKNCIKFLEAHLVEKPHYCSLSECADLLEIDTFNKLTEEDKMYILDSYKVANIDGYDMDDVKQIIQEKFRLLKIKEHAKTWRYDVNKIYLLLNHKGVTRPAKIYSDFANHYFSAFFYDDEMNKKYYSGLLIAIENCENILINMNQEQKEKFLKLGSRNMNLINQYFIDYQDRKLAVKEAICGFLDPLTKTQVETLRGFSDTKFTELLEHCKFDSNIHSLWFCLFDKEFLQDENATIDYYRLQPAMECFPPYFLEILKKKDYVVQKKFINHAKNLNVPTLDSYHYSLDFVPEEYREKVSELIIENEEFHTLHSKKMKMIFMELFHAYSNDNKVLYLDCLEFLLSFASELSPRVLEFTEAFICYENDKEILDAKLEAVENVIEDVKVDKPNIDIVEDYYELYISLLHDVDDLPKKQQLKQLKARSSYFENHQLEDVFDMSDENLSRFCKLLNSDTGRKHHNQTYRLMERKNQYKMGVVNAVIQQLENVSSGKRAKQIIDYIAENSFMSAPYEDQMEQLKNLPGQMVSIEQDGITVTICDIGAIDTDKGEFIFKNKDTKTKVRVK